MIQGELWRVYEILTQHILGQILEQDCVDTITVQRNVSIRGKSATHQIDVYWEFKRGGITYRTIVQAKDWSKPVDQGELLKFKAILDDIPGQPRGVFVTRTGYQSGAKQFADNEQILLYEMREVTESDLQGRIKILEINLAAYIPESTDSGFTFDENWFLDECTRLKIDPSNLPKIKIGGTTDQIEFVDGNGNRIMTAQEIINSFYPTPLQELEPVKRSFTFERDAFVATNCLELPRMRVLAFRSTVRVWKADDKVVISGDDIVQFILKNLEDGSICFFDENVNLIKKTDH